MQCFRYSIIVLNHLVVRTKLVKHNMHRHAPIYNINNEIVKKILTYLVLLRPFLRQ